MQLEKPRCVPALQGGEALLPHREGAPQGLELCLLVKGESSQISLVLACQRPHITAPQPESVPVVGPVFHYNVSLSCCTA